MFSARLVEHICMATPGKLRQEDQELEDKLDETLSLKHKNIQHKKFTYMTLLL